jgi:hypothetical protein
LAIEDAAMPKEPPVFVVCELIGPGVGPVTMFGALP